MSEKRTKTPRQPFAVGSTPPPISHPDPDPNAPVATASAAGTGVKRTITSELQLPRRTPAPSRLLPALQLIRGNGDTDTVSFVLDQPIAPAAPASLPGRVNATGTYPALPRQTVPQPGPLRPAPPDDDEPGTRMSVGFESTGLEHPVIVPGGPFRQPPPDFDPEPGTTMLAVDGDMETELEMEAHSFPRRSVPFGIDPDPDDDWNRQEDDSEPPPSMIRPFLAPPEDDPQELHNQRTTAYSWERFRDQQTDEMPRQLVPGRWVPAPGVTSVCLANDEVYRQFVFLELQASWWTRLLFVIRPDFYRIMKEAREREVLFTARYPEPEDDASELVVEEVDITGTEMAAENDFFRARTAARERAAPPVTNRSSGRAKSSGTDPFFWFALALMVLIIIGVGVAILI